MDAKKILKSIQLPTLSKTLSEIIELEKRNPISFLKDIKKIVEKDPLLSAHILKVANSPLYGLSQNVRTLSHAIGLLGVRKIRTIAFTFSIFDFFKKVKYQPKFGKTFNQVLKKSLLISSICTILGERTGQVNTDELYLSGLLTDIGQMILFLYGPREYRQIYTVIDKDLIPREREAFDTDHVELGMAFCDQWHFPASITTGIKHHFELGSDDGQSKISFIANQVTELLLTDSDEEKKNIFTDLENHTKKLLHLSLTEVEETIRSLPQTMEEHISDFPEVQKDLNRIVETGASLIISLMKSEMDMALKTQELTDSQEKLAKEKIFLSHMLNLSYFLSSLMSPRKIITAMFEYFDNFITEFTIEFIYKLPESGKFHMLTGKDDGDGAPVAIDDVKSLVKSRISNEATRLDDGEMKHFKKNGGLYTMVFPISYHHNFFGFLLLNVPREDYLEFDVEISYVQILANIIANSFQNYHSFNSLKKETNKKEMVTRELFHIDKELDHSKRILVQLQKSEIVAEMLPVIFHKLKNKLTPILGYSQILLSKVDDDNIVRRVRKIEKNANELTDQLNLLRDYFQNEGQPREKENLNHIINHLKPYFMEITAAEEIHVNLDLDFDLPPDLLIPGQVEALITHMVDNGVRAIKARGRKDGIITVKTRNEAEGYTLSVRDNGEGIEASALPMIWTPFYSGEDDRAGLGLTICEKIIANHAAVFNVDSVQGEFSEFKVTFQGRPSDEEDEEVDDAVYEKTGGAKILIVDDEAYLVDLMKEILMNESRFVITTTTKGGEALDLLKEHYDLVISDIRMPEVNGMDIYRYVKTKKKDTKMIMVTADPFSDDVAVFLKKNKIDYLKKPFELMEFKKRVLEKLS